MVKLSLMIKNDKTFIQYIDDLKTLKAKALKLELESEYLPEDLCKEISDILKQNSLSLALKLGGFSSYNDILISKHINAEIIIAPMTETPYALKKFIETLYSVYSKEELLNKKIYINIETKEGIKNFNEIISLKYTDFLEGIIIGRGDLISSFDINPSLINSPEIKNIIIPVIKKCKKENKKIILGGRITAQSINFMKLFEEKTFDGFETRTVLFKTKELTEALIKDAITKAIEFEIYYLKLLLKTENQNICNIQKRIETLRMRLN